MPKRREQKHLTEDECDGLKAACKTFSDQLIVYGLLYTGMRVDELCHMHKGWINLREGAITIPRQEGSWHPKIVKVLDKRTKEIIKEYNSSRSIPVLNPTLIKILESLVKNNYRLDMTPKDVWVRLNQLWSMTGYPGKISPHMLRHTCLTMMVRKDYDITDVARQAGHHNIKITWDNYVHSDNEHLFKSVRQKGGI